MAIESVIVPTKVEQVPTAKSPALRVTYTDGGKEYNKMIFDQAMWPEFAENKPTKIGLEKQGNYWNIVTASSVAAELESQPQVVEKITAPFKTCSFGVEKEQAKAPVPQEIGMWYKELGDWLRLKEFEKGSDPFWATLRRIYFAKMLEVLNIKIEKNE